MLETLKKNWKNIIGSVIFVGIAVAMLTSISYMLRPIDDGAGNRDAFTGFYAQEKNSIDVIAIGSSSLYRFMNNPYYWEKFGVTSYNLATGSQPVETNDWIVREAIKTQTPQLVVVETRPYMKYTKKLRLSRIRFRRSSDYMKYSWNRIQMINDFIPEWKKRPQFYFDAMFYHGEWENFKPEDFKYADNEYDSPMKGFDIAYRTTPVECNTDVGSVEMQPMDEAMEKEVLDLIRLCKEKDIELLFVATPWAIDDETASKNLYMEKLVKENGYNFLDCNRYIEEMGLDFSTDFYDDNHVNWGGSEKVTQFIGDYIKENYKIETNYSQQTIKEWDEAVRYYYEEINRSTE